MEEDAHQGEGSPGGKKQAKKVWYPFGSPSHKNHAFSDFCHLTGQTLDYAMDLATSTGIEPEIRDESDESEKSKAGKKKKGKVKVQINPDLLHDLMNAEGNEPCQRKSCQDVIKKILESESMNKIEREEISEEYERITADMHSNEQSNEQLESKLEELTRDGNQLENTLNCLLAQLDKLEKSKSELVGERDSFNGKVMVLESERQNWNRQLQESEKSLSSALWGKDDKSCDSNDSIISDHLYIKRGSPKSIRSASEVSLWSYNSLARSDVMDVLERPKNHPTLPYYMQEQLVLPAIRHGKSLSYFKSPGSPNSWSAPTQGTLSGSRSTGSLSLTSPVVTASKVNKIRSNTPHLHLQGDAFKGYTPTGSPSYRYREDKLASIGLQSGFLLDDVSSIGGRYSVKSSSGSTYSPPNVDGLDPVFYNERARTSFSRDTAVGKIRVRGGHDELSLNSGSTSGGTAGTGTGGSVFTGNRVSEHGLLLTSKHPGMASMNFSSTSSL